MKHFRFLLFLLNCFVFIQTYAQDLLPNCVKPLAFGKTCSTSKPSIRYHFDKATLMCMAFKFNGCGGNKNNFESDSECQAICVPMGYSTCPANTKRMKNKSGNGETCTQDSDCPAKGYCKKRMNGGGICCRNAAADKFNADYSPKCAKARSAVYIDDSLLIGKNCASKFCPAGSNCKKGNFFATCCGKS